MQGAHSSDLSGFRAVLARRRGAAGRAVRHRVRIGAVALIVALAGCTAEAEEPVPPPPVTTAEPTVAPTTTEPEPKPSPPPTGLVRPEAMNQSDDAGAIAAAEYLTALAFDVVTSMDLTEWSLISGEDCDFCASTIQMVERAVAEGDTYAGGAAEITGEPVIVGRDETLDVLGIDVPIAISAATKSDASGTVIQAWEATTGYFYVELAFGYQGWILMSAHTHATAY